MRMNLENFTRDAIELTVVQKERIIARAGNKESMNENERREFDQLMEKLSGDLQSVADRGFSSCVRMLLERVPELSELVGLGCFLLHYVAGQRLPNTANRGHLDVLKFLLQEDWVLGAIEELNIYKDTPLGAAMKNKQYGAVEILIDHGADTTIRPSWLERSRFHYLEKGDCRLLTFATMIHDVTLLKLLLRKGFKPESEENSEEDGHLCIALELNNLEIVQVLLDHGANVKFDINQRMLPIPTAIDRRLKAPIPMLLERGADINASDELNRDGLTFAITNRDGIAFELLLDHGAILQPKHLEHCVVAKSLFLAEEILDVLGTGIAARALHIACHRGNDEFVLFFLNRGVDPKSESPDPDMNFLEAAVESSNVECVKLLLEAGVDINASEGHIDGNPLYRSVRLSLEEILHILLAAGADTNSKTGEYETALNLAVVAGAESAARKLLEYGADVNKKAGPFGTALSAAIALNKQVELRELLISWGGLETDSIGASSNS